ncbi:hypothetical protein C8R46DRAFT_1036577 [Mycena filopes]|nr:hypothetical protein C8R46DRAFT_1036577 [Mycena filopes]
MSTSMVLALPTELTCMIFTMLILPLSSAPFSYYEARRRLCLVCRRWQLILYGMRQLWAQVIIAAKPSTGMVFVENCLRNIDNQAFVLRLDAFVPTGLRLRRQDRPLIHLIDGVLTRVAPKFKQITSLAIKCVDAECSKAVLAYLSNASAESLTHLRLALNLALDPIAQMRYHDLLPYISSPSANDTTKDNDIVVPFRPWRPSLTRLDLSGYFIRWESTEAWASLRELRLRCAPKGLRVRAEELQSMLGAATRLEILALDGLDLFDGATPKLNISLACLKGIILVYRSGRSALALRSIDAPALDFFQLTVSRNDVSTLATDIVHLASNARVADIAFDTGLSIGDMLYTLRLFITAHTFDFSRTMHHQLPPLVRVLQAVGFTGRHICRIWFPNHATGADMTRAVGEKGHLRFSRELKYVQKDPEQYRLSV